MLLIFFLHNINKSRVSLNSQKCADTRTNLCKIFKFYLSGHEKESVFTSKFSLKAEAFCFGYKVLCIMFQMSLRRTPYHSPFGRLKFYFALLLTERLSVKQRWKWTRRKGWMFAKLQFCTSRRKWQQASGYFFQWFMWIICCYVTAALL